MSEFNANNIKETRELFVSNLNGTTKDVNYYAITLPILLHACLSLWNVNLFQLGFRDLKGNAWLNYGAVLVPYIISITILNEFISWIIALVSFLTLIAATNSILMSHGNRFSPCPWRLTQYICLPNKVPVIRWLFISQMRGLVLIGSAIAILAVDMNIFPRCFAKTETYGFGVMDLGVAMFTLLMGMAHGNSHWKYAYIKKLRTILVLVLIGVVRVIMVKGLEYQEHQSEYGVHWNFFFTLACVNIIAMLIQNRGTRVVPVSIIIAIVALSQHWWLNEDSGFGLEALCLDNSVKRTGLLIANKEGLISLPGYVLLWAIGALIGITGRRPTVLAFILLCWSVLAPSVVTIMKLRVSRRAANLGFVLWSSGVFSWTLLLWIFFDAICNLLEDRANYVTTTNTPDIWCVVNRRGLLYFLVANVLTGMINKIFNTLELDTKQSLILLFVYAALSIFIVQSVDRVFKGKAKFK